MKPQKPKMRRRKGALFAMMASAAVVLTACGGGDAAQDGTADGPVQVTFWHSASGAAADSLNQQIEAFNTANQGQIEAEAIYQGSYQDSMAKLANAVQSGDTPSLMQAADIYTGFMLDSGLTTSATALAETEPYNFDDLAPVIKSYYTVDGEVRSMPYQVSQPALVLNLDVLESAGISPDDVPTDLAGLLDTAQTIKENSGVAGLSFYTTTWWSEQFAATADIVYCTPDNGTGSEPANAFRYTDPQQIAAWQGLQDLVNNGSMVNVGSNADAAVSAFTSGSSAMILVSSGGIGNIESTGVNFAVKPFPVSAPNGGVVPGGNSVWVIGKDRSEAEQQAAWKLATYLGSEEVQVKNFTDSGYLPTTSSAAQAISDPTDAQQALLDQLANSATSIATAGCHSGAMGETRNALQPVLESIIGGADPAQALTEQETAATDIVERYNQRAGN